jgi:inosine-uridine nucleoside N-ribohydrolase
MLPMVDADNAMGSPSGDVDDGFAIAAMVLGDPRVVALSSVRGNTSEALADANNRRIGRLCHYPGPFLRGSSRADESSEASRFLTEPGPPLRFLAFGPLTNLAAAIIADPVGTAKRVGEVVIVGSNASSAGRWPPLWPHEFNLTKDLRAARIVFESGLPLTFAPLDLLKRMVVSKADLEELRGRLGGYIRTESSRWFRRVRLLKLSSTFPVWDLVAAMYALGEPSIRTDVIRATMHGNGWIGEPRAPEVR